MADLTIIFDLQMGEMRTGLWCEPCALPSRAEVDVYLMHDSGVQKMCTVTKCQDCGRKSSVRG